MVRIGLKTTNSIPAKENEHLSPLRPEFGSLGVESRERYLPAKPWPRAGDKLHWTGACLFNQDSVKRNLHSTLPGVLQVRRPMQPFLTDNAEIKPNTVVELLKPFMEVRPVFPALVDGHRVVVKLHPLISSERSKTLEADNLGSLPCGLDVVREIRAYDAVEKLQGSLVPHNYGFYKVQLPSGEHCLMQVLEYVEGIKPVTYVNSLGPNASYEKVDAMLTAFFKSVIELHKCNVLHGDQADRNLFLIYPLDPMNPKFVIYDFNCAHVLNMKQETGDAKRKESLTWLKADTGRVRLFLKHELRALRPSVEKWLQGENGKSLIKAWTTHPTDLTPEQRELSWYLEPVVGKCKL